MEPHKLVDQVFNWDATKSLLAKMHDNEDVTNSILVAGHPRVVAKNIHVLTDSPQALQL